MQFSEFKVSMLKTTMYVQNTNLRKAFQFFDKDNSGLITKKELLSIFASFDDLFNMFESHDYDAIIQQADANNDGKLSYDEFCRFMTSELDQHHFNL